jgi:Ca2+-binding EF-hand superfamily protein
MIMKKTALFSLFMLLAGTALTYAQPSQGGKTPPTAAEIIKEMDTDKDGQLSTSEVKGPIKDDFTKIDTNEDGFLSLEELTKAPKPKGKKED